MWYWPKLILTDHEKKSVSFYKNKNQPGVLLRAYRMQLASQAQPTKGIPQVKLLDKITFSRRTRVFAVSFGGNLGGWRLAVYNTNGTLYTNPAPRSAQFPVVSSLISGAIYNSLALGGAIPPLTLGQSTNGVSDALNETTLTYGHIPPLDNKQNFPWIIEPNWVIQPTEYLIFQGLPIFPTVILPGDPPVEYNLPLVLNIEVFAWEFPGMYKGE